MQWVPITMAGDGKPVIAAEKMGVTKWQNKLWQLLDKGSISQVAPAASAIHVAPSVQTQSPLGVRADNGGFHGVIKATELHVLIYGDNSVSSHGYNAGSGFLPSEGRCEYFKTPSNPDRPHAQTANKIVAFYFDACDAYEEQNGGVAPTHKQLDLFILARAVECVDMTMSYMWCVNTRTFSP